MKNFTTKAELQQYLAQLKAKGAIIGFVPTMGALHRGHLSLITKAQQQCDVVVCSIFVNPTQFTDPRDLEIYPRPLQDDIKKLELVNCDILFNPGVDEMYVGNEQWHLDIGELEGLLEGKFRPGHYQGVTQIVYKLFNIVKPDVAFFGQKDYQQFMVISRMIKLLNMSVKLVMCPIERESDGLAMSSRNMHLTPDDRQHALILSQTLNDLKLNFDSDKINLLKQEAMSTINNVPGVELAYFEIADGDTLLPANEHTKHIIALVAATVGKIRLIDNVIIKNKD
ncbi:pantoate--beta-alanine ligase [Mucilaginibacter sp.]|uniref:pantoate--beta-alanine ligase n=1 Tax=Mucilaginibacter sp. TaxID=1882438 RepID=UPI0026103CB6|nr:pantoate--beta-alanine ligase [Mucilaginibacter sp.]